MIKDFWFGLIVTVLFTLVVFGWLFFSTDKKGNLQTPTLSSSSMPRSIGIWSSLSTLEEYNYGAVEEIKNCFEEYKDKLKEYEQAISEAQKYLDGTYSSRSYKEAVEAAYEQLDIFLVSPSCY